MVEEEVLGGCRECCNKKLDALLAGFETFEREKMKRFSSRAGEEALKLSRWERHVGKC